MTPHTVQQCDVGPRVQLQMQISEPSQFRAAWVDDDQRHPLRAARLMRAPNTGWDSVGFAPTTRISFAKSRSWIELVAADAPRSFHHPGHGRAL